MGKASAAYWDRAGRGPLRPTILHALGSFRRAGRSGPLRVVDLGCGVGRDTLPLLALGHAVHAIDRETEAIARLHDACPAGDRARLITTVARFEVAEWTEMDLAISSFALPFCPPTAFPALWNRIFRRLAAGGRLACQLLGPNDSFAAHDDVTTLSRTVLGELLDCYHVEQCEEEEVDTVTPHGRSKHWHIYHVVARKPDGLNPSSQS